jgi:hypothetical protein
VSYLTAAQFKLLTTLRIAQLPDTPDGPPCPGWVEVRGAEKRVADGLERRGLVSVFNGGLRFGSSEARITETGTAALRAYVARHRSGSIREGG